MQTYITYIYHIYIYNICIYIYTYIYIYIYVHIYIRPVWRGPIDAAVPARPDTCTRTTPGCVSRVLVLFSLKFLGYRIWGSGFRSGFTVQGLGFKV